MRPGFPRGVFSTRIVFRKVIFASLFATAGIGILLLVLWGQSDVSRAPAKKQPTELPKSPEIDRPLLIKMFTYTKVDEYGLNNILEADLLEVRPRRFMVFNAKSVNEAVLKNAHVVLYTYEHKEPAAELFDFFDYECPPPCIGHSRTDAARIEPLGRVTRLVADKIIIELYRDDQKILILEAATGLIDKKKEGVKFFNATLQDVRSHRLIRARKILWDRKRKVFSIPGQYSETGPSGGVSGSSIEIDMDFMITTAKAATG
jgi:hypothetical protein